MTSSRKINVSKRYRPTFLKSLQCSFYTVNGRCYRPTARHSIYCWIHHERVMNESIRNTPSPPSTPVLSEPSTPYPTPLTTSSDPEHKKQSETESTEHERDDIFEPRQSLEISHAKDQSVEIVITDQPTFDTYSDHNEDLSLVDEPDMPTETANASYEKQTSSCIIS